MTAAYQILRRAGGLHSGAESGKGSRWHAVPAGADKALCSVRPAIQWSTEPGDRVTCPRCLRKLERAPAP